MQRTNHFILASLAVTVTGLHSVHAVSSDPPATTEQSKDAPPAEPVLAGPSIEDEGGQKQSLVDRDFNGGLVRIETRPEQAAIELLTLDADQRKAIDALFEARRSKVSALTFDNLELFLTVQTARQSGAMGSAAGSDEQPQREIAAKIRELRTLAAPLIDPPLAEQVSAALPENQRATYTAIVKEYVVAFNAEVQAARGGGSMEPTQQQPRRENRAPAGAEQRFEFSQFLREMARSLSAVVSDRREQTAQLLETVNATPEQASAIQAILQQSSATPGKPATPEQRAATARKIMEVLTLEQRELLRKSRVRNPT